MPSPIRANFTIPAGAQFGAPRAGGRHHQGTDYHCPIGTPIYATGDGRVTANIGETGVGIGFGNYISIAYAGGRVTLDGHLRERSSLAVGTLVNSDTVVAYVGISGNSIYANPPGSHDHHQVWINWVLTDPAVYYGTTTPAGSGSTPLEEDEMNSEQIAMLTQAASDAAAAKYALFYGGNWKNTDGSAQAANYGVLPIVMHNQSLIAGLSAAIAALASAQGLDAASITKAAHDGAEAALKELTLVVKTP